MAGHFDRDILPDVVRPIHYAISIHDIEFGGSFSYQGTVGIRARILRATKQITLNSHELKIHNAEVYVNNAKTESSIVSSDITYDAPKQRATLRFSGAVPASDDVLIAITFQGTINNTMAGFYRSTYKPAVTPAASVPKEGDSYCMFSTQFESSDARRTFPCWDEPNLKATFDVEIELPEDQVALSNMPEKSVKKVENGKQVISFETTPVMSTYLLAWAIGDFEYIEDFTERQYNGKHLPVRVYTTKGLKEHGRYALEHAHKIIDLFSEIFKIDYPLPKIDLLAVHEFSHRAMENWGLVTYRQSALLFDEKTSDPKYRREVVYVVAHELAHQWFGDLVTMDWWSELWLNEGFATWVGWHATDHLHKDWDIWPTFVEEDMQLAFNLDSLRSSHPIEVPVRDALDVDQIFDAISYRKGSSVLRMLAAHLGLETFLSGVSKYLKDHAYGNAMTEDLWSSLSEVSGQDVSALMGPWIKKIGYPVLTVAEEPGQVTVKQSRYLSTGNVKPEDDKNTWWVPLGLKGQSGISDAVSIDLRQKEETLRDIDETFYKINIDNTGVYRTNYPPTRLITLGKQLHKLSDCDKIGLVADAAALAFSGDATTPALLGFVDGFSAEKNYLVWSQVLSSLASVKSVFSEDRELAVSLNIFILNLIEKAVNNIGWDTKPDEDLLTGQLRALLLRTAGMNGHKEVILEAQNRFSRFMGGDDSAIDPSLRSAVFPIVVYYGSNAEYQALKGYWATTTSLDGKELALRALGRIQSEALLEDYLDFLFHSVAVQDIHFGTGALAANPKTRRGLWIYFQEHFGEIKGRLARNMVVFDRFVRVALRKFTDFETEKEIAKFFEGKDNRGYDRSLNNVSEDIRGRASYREKDGAILLEWLKMKKYA